MEFHQIAITTVEPVHMHVCIMIGGLCIDNYIEIANHQTLRLTNISSYTAHY